MAPTGRVGRGDADTRTRHRKDGDPGPPPAVRVRVLAGQAREEEARFTGPFLVGRGATCDVQILETSVSREHLRVEPDGGRWLLRDLGSANGTFVNGSRTGELALTESAEVELGEGGPLLSLELEAPAATPKPPPPDAKAPLTETKIIERYLNPARTGPVGKETATFMRAFERVHRRRSRKYLVAIGLAGVLLLGAGGVIAYQAVRLAGLRQSAERIFYAARSLELQTERLERALVEQGDPKLLAEFRDARSRLEEMEREYDAFVERLDVYGKAPEDQRAILRVVRTFGECEVNVPGGFVEEVRRHIRSWKSSDKLAKALARARAKGHSERILRHLTEAKLPRQYFFLALQESLFDERAVGPKTRYGYAKGMWQFMGPTAQRYGLRLGPLRDQGVYDPADERFQVDKATAAAARYIRDLHATEAQASGLLVMASYNWGEHQVRGILEKMPENPQERNFWKLLARKDVPRETYDYVLAIVSAAALCENPELFGVDLPCPPREGPGGERQPG